MRILLWLGCVAYGACVLYTGFLMLWAAQRFVQGF